MRKVSLVAVCVFLCGMYAVAQDLPRIDAFGGYSYVHFSIEAPAVGTGSNITSNINGGSGAVAFYPFKSLGIVGDIGGYKISTLKQSGRSLDVDATVVTYLFGPRYRFAREGVTPFVQVLFGGAHVGDITSGGTTLTNSQNAFAMTAGGGVDIKIARHFSIRGQGEYLMTRFREFSSSGSTGTQNNARVSAGIVIH